MTSPVDTSVKYFTSDMPGAPVLTSRAGSLVALLDACLVDGWGMQTATSVTVAGGVATATFPADHAAFPDAVVLVAGATPAGLNGEQKITGRAANQVQWATAEADGTATGTITVMMAPAGWDKPFSATNTAVYKSANVQAHGQFFRIINTAHQSARIIGYENMTSATAGTGLFPTSAQFSGGYYLPIAPTTDTTPIAWFVVSDGRLVHFGTVPLIAYYGADYKTANAMAFGDLLPRRGSGDPFATLVAGADTNDATNRGYSQTLTPSGDTTAALARGISGAAGAVRPNGEPEKNFYYGRPYLPNTVTGQIELTNICYRDDIYQNPRATLPGACLSVALAAEVLQEPSWQRYATTGGRHRLMVKTHPSGPSQNSQLDFVTYDITGPWR